MAKIDFDKIIDEYVEYCNSSGKIELEQESIYGIIKPEEIYSSKVVRENTGNPSSRWVSLEVMLDAINNQKMIMNNKNNVYVVPANLISSYFDLKIIDEQYHEMAKFIFECEKDTVLSEEKIGRIFREELIKLRGKKCEFCNCSVDISNQLVASHINARANIRHDDDLTDEDEKMMRMKEEESLDLLQL